MSSKIIELAKAVKLVKKENAKKDYYKYVKYTHDDYEYNRHGEFISNIINDALTKRDAMLNGDIKVENQ